METRMQQLNDSSSSVFLTGTILFANVDSSSLIEYAIKAAIGGAIWMGFKLAADYVNLKLKAKKKKSCPTGKK